MPEERRPEHRPGHHSEHIRPLTTDERKQFIKDLRAAGRLSLLLGLLLGGVVAYLVLGQHQPFNLKMVMPVLLVMAVPFYGLMKHMARKLDV